MVTTPLSMQRTLPYLHCRRALPGCRSKAKSKLQPPRQQQQQGCHGTRRLPRSVSARLVPPNFHIDPLLNEGMEATAQQLERWEEVRAAAAARPMAPHLSCWQRDCVLRHAWCRSQLPSMKQMFNPPFFIPLILDRPFDPSRRSVQRQRRRCIASFARSPAGVEWKKQHQQTALFCRVETMTERTMTRVLAFLQPSDWLSLMLTHSAAAKHWAPSIPHVPAEWVPDIDGSAPIQAAFRKAGCALQTFLHTHGGFGGRWPTLDTVEEACMLREMHGRLGGSLNAPGATADFRTSRLVTAFEPVVTALDAVQQLVVAESASAKACRERQMKQFFTSSSQADGVTMASALDAWDSLWEPLLQMDSGDVGSLEGRRHLSAKRPKLHTRKGWRCKSRKSHKAGGDASTPHNAAYRQSEMQCKFISVLLASWLHQPSTQWEKAGAAVDDRRHALAACNQQRCRLAQEAATSQCEETHVIASIVSHECARVALQCAKHVELQRVSVQQSSSSYWLQKAKDYLVDMDRTFQLPPCLDPKLCCVFLSRYFDADCMRVLGWYLLDVAAIRAATARACVSRLKYDAQQPSVFLPKYQSESLVEWPSRCYQYQCEPALPKRQSLFRQFAGTFLPNGIRNIIFDEIIFDI